MRMLDLILKKKRGEALRKEEIDLFISEYTRGEIPDYQVSALLMAICFQGMNREETAQLTMAMAHSGDRVDLAAIPGIKVDKHSTGGVGDKTTLIIGPAAAALGIPIAKMSGRGLGHTGGTIDKMESIPGLQTSMSEEQFIRQVREIGIAIAGQTANLAPADKKLYALRDVTGTVQELSLIASSIMSKKLAAGADKIVLDVKCGSGAFMKTQEDAMELAEAMVRIGQDAGLDCHALVSNMDQPLGLTVGNRLEVREAVEVLNGQGPEDLIELSVALITEMAFLAELGDHAHCAEEAKRVLSDGSALAKLRELVIAQGGDASYIDQPEKLLAYDLEEAFVAEQEGVITHIESESVGLASGSLGAGRSRLEDDIDPKAGILFKKKVGDRVKRGETICLLRCAREELFEDARTRLQSAIRIGDVDVSPSKVILGRVD